jgi:hypothetical protein
MSYAPFRKTAQLNCKPRAAVESTAAALRTKLLDHTDDNSASGEPPA